MHLEQRHVSFLMVRTKNHAEQEKYEHLNFLLIFKFTLNNTYLTHTNAKRIENFLLYI